MEGFFEKVKKGLAALKKPLGRLPVRRGLSPEKAGPSLKSGKKYIAWACAAALVLLLAIMPMAAGRSSEEEHQASIVSDQAQLRELETRVLGGGQLSGEAALSVTVPEGVKIKEYLVKNGDSVEEGQAIARVDPVSVMTAIASIQESLDYLSEEINALSSEADTQTVSSGAPGLVKQVYAQEGDSVSELMLDKGALAVLSLDGLMAVETETDTELSTGEKVVVSFPDGSEAEGSVKSNVERTLTVTLEDEGYEPGTEVSLATEAGESLGSGELYINSPWKVSAYTGDVSYVYIQAGQQVYEGQSLFGLENTGHSAEYQLLVDEHRDYEELMQELFSLYESRTVTAPCDGIVTGVDEEGSYMLLSAQGSTGGLVASSLVNRGSASGSTGGIVLLSAAEGDTQPIEDGTQTPESGTQPIEDGTQPTVGNTQPLGGVEGEGDGGTEGEEGPEPEPGGDTGGQISITTTALPGATVGQSYSAQLSASDGTGAVSGSWSVQGLPDGLSLEASTGLISGVPTATGSYTLTVGFTADSGGGAQTSLNLTVSAEQSQPSASYYGYAAKLTEISGGSIKVMQTPYSYTITDLSSLPSVTVRDADLTVEKSYDASALDLTGLSVGDKVFLVTDGGGQLLLVSKLPSGGGEQGPDQGGMEGGMGGMSGAMGSMGGMSGGSTAQEESFQLYSLEEQSIASVTSQEHMSLEIQVDELDISRISLGQEALISVDALGGEQFEATVTGIANTGENEGGNSKFAVELTVEKSGDMLPGMSASASISLGSSGRVLCVPVAALDKEGSQDVVYTGCDEDDGRLTDPVAVTTGVSDGEYVQLLSGLEEGQTVYYAWYEAGRETGLPELSPPFGA